MQIVIDKEFQALIPPLTVEEYEGLEKSILADGCRDALVLWGDILVDGHNRYEICTAHDVPFQTVQKDFADRNDALRWIILNQFGRRNLPAYERARLALRLKPVISEKAKEQQRDAGGAVPQKSAKPPIDTRQEIAKAAGVSHDTIAKVEKIERQAAPEVKEQLRKGEMSINQAFQTIRREEKKQDIQRAQESIAAQVADSPDRPVVHIGSGIGHIPDKPYDLLLTDPPYSTDVDDIDAFARSWLYNALDHIKDTGFAYVFIGAYPNELRAYLNIEPPAHMELTQVLMWSYRNTLGITPKDRYDQSYQACLFYRGKNAPMLDCPLTSEKWAVMEINAPGGITEQSTGDKRYHSWQKPMEIAERFVRHATRPGMTVFDPFACTGTFLLAAAKLGRKAYGFEINPDNAALAVERGCASDTL